MSLIRTLVMVAVLALIGCDAANLPDGAHTTASTTSSPLTNGMEFSGQRDCVDCDGIEAWLRLEQVGKLRRYRMVEVYYDQDHDRRFEDSGAWSTEGDLLRLSSRQGGERVYARSVDGYLQARGGHGQRIAAIEGDVLEPARFDSTQ